MNKSFIIQDGKAYLEKNGKAYEIEFNDNLTFNVTSNELKDISNNKRYFLKEVLAKLNIKYKLANRVKNVSRETKIEKENDEVVEKPKYKKITKEE